jgi:hypothetical protein
MFAELDHVEDDGEALRFAGGCLAASLWASFAAAPWGIRVGRSAVALVTIAYAIFHLQAALRGIDVLAGAPDPHYARMERRSIEAAEAYQALRPFTVLLMAGTGIAHLVAAVFLVAWRPRFFAGALVLAGIPVASFRLASGVITGSPAWPIQLLPILILGAAGAVLAMMAKRLSRWRK